MNKYKSASALYLHGLSHISAIMAPLSIAVTVIFLFGHLFEISGWRSAATGLHHSATLLIDTFPLLLCLLTAHQLAMVNRIGTAVMCFYSLLSFVFVSASLGYLDEQNHLPINALLAVLCPLLCFKIYVRWPLLVSSGKHKYMPLDTGSLQAAMLVLGLLVIALWLVIFQSTLFTFSPLQGLDSSTLTGAVLLEIKRLLSLALGIFPSDILPKIATPATNENISGLITPSVHQAFASLGGSGNAWSLILCILLFCRDKKYITLAIAAIPLSFFNLSPLLFWGLPILFNPYLIAPFILVPVLSLTLVYLSMMSGLIIPTAHVLDPLTPPLLSGYLVTGSLYGPLLQIVLILLGVMVYRYFFLRFTAILRLSEYLDEEMAFTLVNPSSTNSDEVAKTLHKGDAQETINRILSEGNLLMHYQPQRNFNDDNYFTFEALLRHKTPDGKIHSPTFIDAFRLQGAMFELDMLVLNTVFQDMKSMPLRSGDRITINLSAGTFARADFVELFFTLQKKYGIHPKHIGLEVTEETELNQKAIVLGNITRLKMLNVRMILDDFGTGYTSIPHLTEYPFNEIKIDRSLLLNAQKARGRDFYEQIIKLSEVLEHKVKVVAEGVETKKESDFLLEMGVSIQQGYYHGEPRPLTEMIAQLQQRDSNKEAAVAHRQLAQ